MEKIIITRSTLGDTRSAEKVPTFFEFTEANVQHKKDVENMTKAIAVEIERAGRHHDYTKINEPHQSLFYRELCAKIEGKIDSFTDGEWYPMHCATERHHINEEVPLDVNLVDVLEMICDCVCAGMARKGEVYPVTIDPEVLQKAFVNTVQMCIDSVILDEVTA